MVNSMTGFAALKGVSGGIRWNWELRSVNARGLDIRLRLPEGCDEVEPALRKSLTARLSRGSVSLGLRLRREATAAPDVPSEPNLAATLGALAQIENAAGRTGMQRQAEFGSGNIGAEEHVGQRRGAGRRQRGPDRGG